MKKIIKRIITVIIALALFVGIGVLLRYLMFDDVDSYSRLMFHAMRESEETIDILFVGSSHVRRSINPYILDELFGANTFNGATASQVIDGSLGVIQEACKTHDVKKIFLDMYYMMIDAAPFAERSSMTATYLVTDYMKPSLEKAQLLLRAGDPKTYSNGLIVARRNWEQIFDTQYISDLFERKQEQTYLDYVWTDKGDSDYYVGKGYFANDTVIADTNRWDKYAYGPTSAVYALEDPECDWYKTFRKIVDFCKERGIELILYTTPEPEWTFIGKGNYQDFSDGLTKLAQANGLAFYDFNLLRPEYFDDNDRDLFMDIDHMNTAGASKFSTLLGEFFNGGYEGEDLFYADLAEKLADEPTRVYGAAIPWNGLDEVYPNYIISNRSEGIEYRITSTSYTTGERTVIQDFDENIYFFLPVDESGVVEIRWRVKGEEDVRVVELEY